MYRKVLDSKMAKNVYYFIGKKTNRQTEQPLTNMLRS